MRLSTVVMFILSLVAIVVGGPTKEELKGLTKTISWQIQHMAEKLEFDNTEFLSNVDAMIKEMSGWPQEMKGLTKNLHQFLKKLTGKLEALKQSTEDVKRYSGDVKRYSGTVDAMIKDPENRVEDLGRDGAN
eukprot:GHVS01005504.1.p1 GENE.GHVS01005504.1~~GHVS01005504.1.p1  ORF type:complete len:146 (+),score=10.98 GHVS01005504.1:43-438(+)